MVKLNTFNITFLTHCVLAMSGQYVVTKDR